MKMVDLKQGTQEWHDFRSQKFTASDAAAMLGFFPYKTRDQLLAEKATGITKEVTPEEQRRFDKGHQAEVMARAILEDEIGTDLYPVTGYSEDKPRISASLDGLTFDDSIVFEHKLWSEKLAAYISENNDLPDSHWPQVEQQLFVSGAGTCIFVVSDGTTEKREKLKYHSKSERLTKVLLGWDQFEADLENYQAPEAKPEVVAEAVRDLPALTFNLDKTTLALSSNLGAYKAAAEQLVERSKEELTSDQQFADAAERIKVFKKSEEKLAAVIEQVQGEITDVDSFIKDVRHIAENIRKARLASEKQVEARKKQIKLEIIASAKSDLADHVAALNAELEPATLPEITADFAAAIKGKKTVNSLQSAANDALAAAKIEATQMAEQIRSNVAKLAELADGYQTLFPDLSSLALKSTDDFTAAVKARVAEQKEAERQREEQIRAEEAAKAEAAQPQKDSSLALEPSSEPAPSIAEIPVKPASELKAPAKTTSATRTLGDALRHFCKVKNLGEQDAQELLDIVAGYTALDVA